VADPPLDRHRAFGADRARREGAMAEVAVGDLLDLLDDHGAGVDD
jgi:hypothetical protein